MSHGEIEKCPICELPMIVTKRWHDGYLDVKREWPCTHTPQEYQAALEEYESKMWDMSLEAAGEDA